MLSSVFATLLFYTTAQVVNGDVGAYTSYPNLEKLYTLEDDLLLVSDVLLKHEQSLHGDEDIHNIYNISTTVDSVREIHDDVASSRNLTSYLTHPINIYHMIKRLSRDWNAVLATLEGSKSCSKDMKLKIDNMSDNVPTGKHLQLIIRSLLRMQAFYNLTADDVTSGNFTEGPPPLALSLDDAFDIARVAYEMDQLYLAVDWLKFVMSQYDEQSASFKKTNAMNLMASAYLKLEQPNAALNILDEVIKLDPTNTFALRNTKFIMKAIDSGMKDKIVSGQLVMTKKEQKLQELCSAVNKTTKGVGKNLFCTYTRHRSRHGIFDRASIKTEVMSRRPLIVMYREMTNTSEQKAVRYLGYDLMKQLMYEDKFQHPNGIDGLNVEDRSYWRWVDRMKNLLQDIEVSNIQPTSPSQLWVKNIGMEGYESQALDQSERYLLGTYYVFLSQPKHGGGDIVFPMTGITVVPEQGSVLFFERTANKQLAVCPVIADTQWLGIYPLQGKMFSDVCYSDPLIRPKRA